MKLPKWVREFKVVERVYLALYVVARHLLDYGIVTAMHVYGVRDRVVLRSEILVSTLREAEAVIKVPRGHRG